MVFESAAAALMGYLGYAASVYASRSRRLLAQTTETEEAGKLSLRFLIEPVTASIMVVVAIVGGSLVWTLGWFVVGPVVAFVVRRLRS
jgi:hypothetical protein